MTSRHPLLFLTICCTLISASLAQLAHAAFDPDATREIWRLKYGVTAGQAGNTSPAGWLSMDDDGDGLTNGAELAAGTNPFDPVMTFSVDKVVLSGGNAEIFFPTEIGKRYRVECALELNTWVLQPPGTPAQVIGDGTTMMISVPSSGQCFYRVRVDEVDSDGDTIGDWAEGATGLDSNLQETVPGINDGDYVNAQLLLPNTVSVVPTDPAASEDGPESGCVTITRAQSLFPITVNYTVRTGPGSATPGSDYGALGTSVALAPGVTTMDLFVNPIADAEVESTESVTVDLTTPASPSTFQIGYPASATVVISDPTAPTGTGLLANYYNSASSNYSNSANFNPSQLKITRVDPVVDNDWLYGTPNGANYTTTADNYSVSWDGYLAPSFAGTYSFQLDADDKARVLLDTGSGLVQILENGWDTPATGDFKQSGNFALTVPASPANRYHMRVEFVEVTGDATCRIQWKLNSGNFANIPAGNAYTDNTGSTTGWNANYYDGTNFDTLKGSRTDSAITNGNNGIWGSGTPDVTLINRDTFSIRWTGQVQPQFSEDYTFSVIADNGCKLFINGQEQDFRLATASNTGGNTYSYDSVTGDCVIDYSNGALVPDNFAPGDIVRLDPTSGNLTGLSTLEYLVTDATSTTFTVNFGAGAFASGSGNINIDSLNRVLKPWASTGAERYTRLSLLGGVRYDITLEFYETTSLARCRLFWYSPSQPKEIIPQNRLYPSSVDQQPSSILSPTDAVALVGGPFSYEVDGSNGAIVTVSDLPAWLSYAGGAITGTPPAGSAGLYQIIITSTSAAGTGTSVLNLEVLENEGIVEREYWTGVSGTTVAAIPVSTNPTGTEDLTSLEAATDFGNNYGARIRGYITAPVTGNYYFWIASYNAAELWISNDDEPVNSFRRAWVNTGNAAARTWNGEPNQRSPWLALEAGQRYYVEILHKAGVGAGDNLAVGWAMPGQPTTAPSEVVPGYALSPYVAPAPGSTPGTLYVATMLAQGAAVSNGVGSSTLKLSEDETHAYMRYSYGNLTGPITAQHIHTDPYLTKPSTIVYDIDTPDNPGDGLITDPEDPNFGAYLWTITPVGTLSAADIIEIIKQGKAYINLHTALYPNGEIRGNYTLAAGSRTFSPPPAPPAWSDDSNTDKGAARFLTQATFGPNLDDITALKALPATSTSGRPATRYETWIDNEFAKGVSLQLPEVLRTEDANAQGGAFTENLTFNAWWWNSVAGDDQLRQRVAFALSEIHVVSAQGPLDNRAQALSYFYDTLATNAFGNFRDILEDTTLTWPMGRYLDMWRNDKPDPSLGRIPNENYAREIKQLFSVGLFRMWPDGTLILTSEDQPIDTYSQREIIGFAHAFTGWDYGYDGPYRTAFNAPADFTRQMREVPARHFTGPKRLLNNEVLPGLDFVGAQPLDPYALHNSMVYNDPAYEALAVQDIDATHDQLFEHPNTGPFICRQLIQRLVTSHPSRGYLYRVVQAFNDNGSGVRGDMQAVIKAILLDYEARSPFEVVNNPAFGKQREAVMRVAAAGRAFRPDGFSGTYSQNGSQTITITTTTPHGLASGNGIFLDFTTAVGGPAPWIGRYTVSGTPASSTTFNVSAFGWVQGSYSIPSGSTVCTVTMNNHWLQAGHKIYVDFISGGANGTAVDTKVYTLTTASPETGSGASSKFTFAVPSQAGSRTGTVMFPRFSPGSYTARASGLPYPNDRRVEMDTDYDHHLQVGDQVQLNFFAGNPLPLDAVVTVESIVDLNTWTYLTNSDPATGFAANENNNGVYQFPLLSQPLVRSGDVGSRPSTFLMNNTDADLDQAPLNSPTVFNFFLPDFKNPGTLASQGITTPEFQTTAETTVIRQANYLYNGIFNPNTANGYSSFTNGNNALVMDLSPWMEDDAANLGLGTPNSSTVPWTHNQNIARLIDHLSILLTADQLSIDAKGIIRNFVSLPIASIQVANPCIVDTTVPHGYQTGDLVCLSGVSTTGNFRISGVSGDYFSNTSTSYPITVVDADTFTVNGVQCLTAPNASSNDHVSQVPYNQGTTVPDAALRRDRLRAIIHLILTSPDFTIQR